MNTIMSKQEAGPTRAANVLDTLRDEIVDARLEPGARLRFDRLREEYGVGISPLREALTHLASEGLVVSEQRKGFRVAPVSADDLREIARLRSEFDALAVTESISHGDELWEGRVVAAFHALSKRKKLGEDGEIDHDWESYHIGFHQALVEACRMPKLLSFREILEQQARRYRRISVHYLTSPRDDLGEHQAICDAVLARNAPLASELIRAHYLQTVEIILSRDSEHPSF